MKRRRPSRAHVARFRVDDLEVLVIDLPPDAVGDGELTDAEREVARLAASGLRNQEIARARGTSTSTVANQLGSIYKKLGVSSRFELAAWWTGTGAKRAPAR